MSMSRIPVPEATERARAMSLKTLWDYSPSGTLSSFCAGLISAASVSLISLYAYERGFTGVWLLVHFLHVDMVHLASSEGVGLLAS
jgi:hypothetical protein